MRTLLVALAVVSLAAAGCGDDDDDDSGGGSTPEVDVDSEAAQDYLAELEAAGLGDVYEDDEQAVAYVATACANAVVFEKTPEELIASGELSEAASIALGYCDTELAGAAPAP